MWLFILLFRLFLPPRTHELTILWFKAYQEKSYRPIPGTYNADY